jgi:cytochrome b pre-mRNA-processing protein 3
MFGFLRPDPRKAVIDRLHGAIVEASRRPALYEATGFPDTFEGRFEALSLHVLLVLRRLRGLPAPAGEVAQELVDSVFAHLEAAMRETGVGDMGVPKKMKKLGRAFYDRMAKYEDALERRDSDALAAELGRRIGREGADLSALADHLLAAGDALAGQGLDAILAAPAFPDTPLRSSPEGIAP